MIVSRDDDRRQAVLALWRSRGGAWDKWSDQLALLSEKLNQPLLEAAALAPGQAVLDLASGAGEPALNIARAVGPEGLVLATDPVARMLAGARRRAAAGGLNQMRFAVTGMERLPVADVCFDRITCRFGIMFVPDAGAALAEARRVLRPGGIAAFMVWGPAADTTLFHVLRGVIERVVGAVGDDPELNQFRFAAAGTLGGLFGAAGFSQVAEHEHYFAPTPAVGVRFWQPNLEMALGDRLASLNSADRARLDQEAAAAFAAYIEGEVYRLKAHARVVVGRAL